MNGTQDPLHIVLIVLGDVGRSPRMQYHALSLLERGHFVTLVGYHGEELIEPLQRRERLHVRRFDVPCPNIFTKIRIVYFLWRIFSVFVWLLAELLRIPRIPVDTILVQNPPALPLLIVTYIYCQYLRIRQLKRPAYIIDWHNLGYAMLEAGTFQNIAKIYEKAMAPLADAHFTVTEAMKDYVGREIVRQKNNLYVVPDGPPVMFQPLSIEKQHSILQKLDKGMLNDSSWKESLDSKTQTLFTEVTKNGSCRPRPGRPALVTSSTSWTSDEDFGILWKALRLLDQMIESNKSSMKVAVVVTGKGPQRAFYEKEMETFKMKHVAVQTLWLDPSDYPLLLACADVGVSLHTSTSGLDLPMKVLDYFGCGLPVCAKNFACLDELVKEGEHGRVFDTAEDLANDLWELLSPLEKTPGAGCHAFGPLKEYSERVKHVPRWDQTWTTNALPIIEDIPRPNRGKKTL